MKHLAAPFRLTVQARLPKRLQPWVHKLSHSDLVNKVAETFATRVLLIGLNLITGVIIARTLGPEGRGAYAAAVAIGGLGVQFGNLGLHSSNTYYVAKDRLLLPTLLANSLVTGLGIGLLAALGAWLLFWLEPALAPVQGSLLILAFLWIPIGLTYLLVQNLQLGIQQVRNYNLIELVTKILSVVLLSILIIAGLVRVELVFSVALSMLALSCLWSIYRLQPHLLAPVRPSWALFRNGISYGFRAYLAAFFSYLVLRADLLMVKQISGATAAGYYATAAGMADLVYMLPLTISTILFPKLAAMESEKERWHFVRQIILVVIAMMVVISVIAALLAQPAITLLYGQAFMPAVPAFRWLLPAILFLSVNTILVNYFAANGMPLIVVVTPGVAAALNLGLNAYWIQWWGIKGAAAASVTAYGLMLICSLLYIGYVKRISR